MTQFLPDGPRWLLAVLNDPTAPVSRVRTAALVGIQPVDDTIHDQIAKRFRACGAGIVRARQFGNLSWPRSATAAVDVVGGQLIRITTGMASLYTGTTDTPPLPVTGLWTEAARARRTLVLLVPPGTMTGDEQAVEAEQVAQLHTAAAGGRLLGMTARARFDLPVSRPGGVR